MAISLSASSLGKGFEILKHLPHPTPTPTPKPAAGSGPWSLINIYDKIS